MRREGVESARLAAEPQDLAVVLERRGLGSLLIASGKGSSNGPACNQLQPRVSI